MEAVVENEPEVPARLTVRKATVFVGPSERLFLAVLAFVRSDRLFALTA
jgi:hypothetical protein